MALVQTATWGIKPAVRAYALSYLASTGPHLLSSIRYIKRKDVSRKDKLALVGAILKTSTELNRLPAAVALIIAGTTSISQLPIAILQRLATNYSSIKLTESTRSRIRQVTTFISAWIAFDMLNRDKAWRRKRTLSRSAVDVDTSNIKGPNEHHAPPPSYHPRYAGKTIDFTLFAAFRAVDILVINSWLRTRSRAWHPEHRAPKLAKFAKAMMDPWIFASSASVIMWAWFHMPQRLPKAYNKWISSAASIDPRLIQALRRCRTGEFVYGQDTGQAPLLQSLCDELGLPQDFGDPAKTIPIPCELYHSGAGRSCEVHAMSRFWRSFIFSLRLYLPLQLIAKIRHPNLQSLKAALRGAVRSSSFLASFVTLFYYSVCLARTRIGPKVISHKTITPQMWDSGLCVFAGCLICGWSVLAETAHQRQELAFFVAPRALATLLPRVYDRQYQRREQFIFAASVVTVLSAAQSRNTQAVRGVFGRLLSGILKS